MTHTELVEAMMVAASDAGLARLFKNQSGVNRMKKEGRIWVVPYGVGPEGGGGHDLLGWKIPTGQFCSLDAKIWPDKLSASQKKWARWVIAGGGIAGAFYSVEEGLALLRGG